MKKGTLLIIYIVIAAAVIGFGAWWANSLTQPSLNSQNGAQDTAGATQVETSTQNTTSTTMDNLKIVDTTVGTGTLAQDGDAVTVNYTGTLDDGTVFDSSLKPGRTPFTFVIGATGPGAVIQGWNEGVLGMRVGGTRELTIPPSLGYGAYANGPIPANSTLHFTITLLSVSSSTSSSGQ